MKRPIIMVLLSLARALVGTGIGAVAFFAVNNGFPTNNPFDQRNISYELEESKTLKVDADEPLTLKVIDESGSVTITGADVEAVEVLAIKTAYDSTEARADEVDGLRRKQADSVQLAAVQQHLRKPREVWNG